MSARHFFGNHGQGDLKILAKSGNDICVKFPRPFRQAPGLCSHCAQIEKPWRANQVRINHWKIYQNRSASNFIFIWRKNTCELISKAAKFKIRIRWDVLLKCTVLFMNVLSLWKKIWIRFWTSFILGKYTSKGKSSITLICGQILKCWKGIFWFVLWMKSDRWLSWEVSEFWTFTWGKMNYTKKIQKKYLRWNKFYKKQFTWSLTTSCCARHQTVIRWASTTTKETCTLVHTKCTKSIARCYQTCTRLCCYKSKLHYWDLRTYTKLVRGKCSWTRQWGKISLSFRLIV